MTHSHTRAIRRLVCLLTFPLIISACSPGGESEPEEKIEVVAQKAFDEGIERALADKSLDSSQRAALEDGKITFLEYERAIGRTLECLRDENIPVTGGQVKYELGTPVIRYGYGVTSPGRTEEQTDAVSQFCIETYSLSVAALWENAPEVFSNQRKVFQENRVKVVQCLQEGGLEASVDISFDSYLKKLSESDDMRIVSGCSLERIADG